MYNPHDWQLGDLVIMELDLSRVRASDDAKERNRGREVRMLVNRDVIGTQGQRHDVWQGKHGSVKKVLRDPLAVVYIERMFPVDQPTLDRVNRETATIYGSNLRVTVPESMVEVREVTLANGHTMRIPVDSIITEF